MVSTTEHLNCFPSIRLWNETDGAPTKLDRVLVMQRGLADLSDVISHGGFAGKNVLIVKMIAMSVAKCLKEMNGYGFIHGDVKSRNFVMVRAGEYAAIDLDAAAPIDGKSLAGQKTTSSGCLPPEQAQVVLHQRLA